MVAGANNRVGETLGAKLGFPDMLTVTDTLGVRRERQGSSIASNTPELGRMRESEKLGRPASHYELAQNSCDYNGDLSRQPRIVIGTADGVQVFDGKPIGEGVEVKAIEYWVFGSSYNPARLTLFSHGGGDNTLGVNGRGAGLTYANLVEQGMRVIIASNFDGETYVAEPQMIGVKGESDVRNMVVDVEYGSRLWQEDEKVTVIRIENPTREQVDLLGRLPENFLLANPNYHGAKLVESRGDAVSPMAEMVVATEGYRSLRVEVLEQVSGWDPTEGQCRSELFVGGLRVKTRYYGEVTALPWAIWGGEHMQDNENLVGRSVDSTEATGRYSSVIANAIRSCESGKVFKSILDVNNAINEKKSSRYTPIELGIEGKSLSPISKEVLTKVLKERHGGQLPAITKSKAFAINMTERFGEGSVILVNGDGLWQMLEETGCASAESKLGVKEISTDGYLMVLVPSEPDMGKLLAEIGGGEAKFKIVTTPYGREIVVTGVPEEGDLKPDSFDALPTYFSRDRKLLDIVSYFLAKGVGVEVQLTEAKSNTKFTFGGREEERYGKARGEFNVEVTSLTEAAVNKPPRVITIKLLGREYFQKGGLADFVDDKLLNDVAAETDMLRKIDSLKGQGVEAMANRIRDLEEKLANDRKAEKKAKQVTENIRLFLGRQMGWSELMDQMRNRIRSGVEMVGFSNERAELGVTPLSEFDSSTIRFNVKANGLGFKIGGYYREGEGDRLVVDQSGSGAHWESTRSQYETMSGVDIVPTAWEVATTLEMESEWQKIPIKIGMSDVTYVSDDGIEVEIDQESRTIRARGEGKITFYQRRAKNGLFKERGPTAEDLDIDCKIDDLEPGLANQLKKIRDGKYTLSDKQALVMALHNSRFVYDDNPEVAATVMNNVNTKADFERNLLNVSRGTCNYSATAATLMLRLVGNPAEVEFGGVTGGRKSTSADTHMWPKAWNGKRWNRLEATEAMISKGMVADNLPREAAHSLVALLGGLLDNPKTARDLLSETRSPMAWAKVVISQLMVASSQSAAVLRSVGRIPVNMKNFISEISDEDVKLVVQKMMAGGLIVTADMISGLAQAIAAEQKEKLGKLE